MRDADADAVALIKPVAASPGWQSMVGIFRVLDSYLLAEDLAGVSASEPAINGLAYKVSQTWLQDGGVICAERGADACGCREPWHGR
jgi:hypothetical protein